MAFSDDLTQIRNELDDLQRSLGVAVDDLNWYKARYGEEPFVDIKQEMAELRRLRAEALPLVWAIRKALTDFIRGLLA